MKSDNVVIKLIVRVAFVSMRRTRGDSPLSVNGLDIKRFKYSDSISLNLVTVCCKESDSVPLNIVTVYCKQSDSIALNKVAVYL
jgi:hypothetical protein